MLRHIEQISDGEAIYLLKDLAPHLSAPATARTLRDLTQKLETQRSTVVLTGDPVELPRELDAVAVRFDLELPDEEELRDMVRLLVESMSARQRVRLELSRDDAQRIVHALCGLTLKQARQVIAQAIVDDNSLSAADMDTIVRCKGELIEKGGVLEFFAHEENDWQLGGLRT